MPASLRYFLAVVVTNLNVFAGILYARHNLSSRIAIGPSIKSQAVFLKKQITFHFKELVVAQSASKMLVTFALVDFGASSRLYPICCQLVPCGSKLAATDKCRLQFLEKILTLLLLLALPFLKRKFLRFHDANIGKEADVIYQ